LLVDLPPFRVLFRLMVSGLKVGAEETDLQPAIQLLHHIDGPVGGETLSEVLLPTGQQSFLVATHRTDKAAVDSFTTIARRWPCPLGE
jgi:hypothetical protein